MARHDLLGPRPSSALPGVRHLHADRCVLLDGFPLKHVAALGAEVPVAVTSDRAGALALADELAPDVRRRWGGG